MISDEDKAQFMERVEKVCNGLQKACDKAGKRAVYWLIASADNHELFESKRKARQKRDLKYCFVTVGHTRFMAMIDKATNKVYKIDDRSATYMEWKRFYFDRYCTGFDL